MWFKESFSKLILLLLPTFLRKSKMIAWLSALIHPMQNLSETILYQMQHDGRVIYLEKVLNEHFQITDYDSKNHETTKKIFIEDAFFKPKTYIYQSIEEKPIYLGTVYLGGNEQVYNFIVKVPTSLIFNENEMKFILDYYKLAGKKYKIELI